MDTDLLIERLASDVPRIGPVAVHARITTGILVGGLASTLIVLTGMGVRPDLAEAVRGGAFWVKLTYTASLAVLASAATIRFGRPGQGTGRQLWLMTLPVLVLGAVGVGELFGTPSATWAATWLGKSSAVCPWRILALATPFLLCLLWSLRQLAPTNLRLAGAAAGLAAGALGAVLYCLRCPESSAVFVLTWYTLGMLLAGGAGALLGPWLLRW